MYMLTVCVHTVFAATIEDGQVIVTFLVLVGFNLIFALIAGILIALEVSYSFVCTKLTLF